MAELNEDLHDRLNLLVPINKLNSGQQEQLLVGAVIMELRKREYVFREGERDPYSFYLLDGELEMHAGDQLIKHIVGGEGASYHPLAQLLPRQMSALARTPARVLRIDRPLLDRLLSAGRQEPETGAAIEVTELETEGAVEWLASMLQSELFTRIPPANIQKLLDTLEAKNAAAGDVIIKQGAPGDFYYVIQSGRCEVCRSTTTGKEIKLAELGPGDTFGEEALISNAKRNATVRMITDGTLGRLTKKDFVALISAPVLHAVGLAEARELVAGGARWLDVRFPEEHRANGLPDSVNLPLSFLRARVKELDQATHYVAYCDTGGRASAAAFLLTQEGFEASCVDGGAIDEIGAREAVAPAAPPQPAAPAPADAATSVLEADARAESLAADLAKATIQIDQARRLMAQAMAAKQNVDRFVQESLQQERERIHQEAQFAQGQLAEAHRLKDEIERRHQEALVEAERRRRELDEQALAAQREAERKLKEEQQRLEALYRDQTEQYETLQQERARTKQDLEDAWRKIETESSLSKERFEAALKLEEQIKAREVETTRLLAEREAAMRDSMKAELTRERQKLEAEFAKTAETVARARLEQQAAEAAKQAAAEEARRIVEEFREAKQQLVREHQAKLLAERERLEVEAAQIRERLALALRAKAEAEASKGAAENQLSTLQQRARHAEAAEQGLREEIAALERQVESATHRFDQAVTAQSQATQRQQENEARLERSYSSEGEIDEVMRRELDDWVREHDRTHAAPNQREFFANQRAQTERIRERAAQAKQATESRTFSLLDEIAAQLGEYT
ncbi:MAG: cyclic nucleotide-binding domain-containing protein [Gammaproteobacteria bacterium]|nr:cyclic nucleotide-binding domain-containing protein [Gammaproteobacteria bacterium]